MVTLNPDAPPVARATRRGRGADRRFRRWRATSRRSARRTAGTPTGRCSPRISWRATICRSAIPAPSAACRGWRTWSARRARAMFNYHTILKDDSLKIALAHPDNTRLKGDRRRTTFLLVGLSEPADHADAGLFLVSVAASARAGAGRHRLRRRHVAGLRLFAGGAGAFRGGEDAARQGQRRGSRLHGEGLSRACCPTLAEPGHLSHLERPNFDFAQYLAERTGGFERRFG